MSKDPAFLFYPGDWLGGTMTFSRAQKGAYMDLLMAQFNQVGLTINDIKQILGTDFWMWESKLKLKFREESNGLYFNHKLRTEQIRRRLYTQTRKDNLHKDNHMDVHMETVTVIENRTETKIPPCIDDVTKYCKERNNGVIPNKWFDYYQARGWKYKNGQKMTDWKAAVRTWEKNKEQYYAAPALTKRTAIMCILDYRILKWDNQRIKQKLLEEEYSENDIEIAFEDERKSKNIGI